MKQVFLRMFKYWYFLLGVLGFIILQVQLELKLPEYLSEVIIIIQGGGSNVKEKVLDLIPIISILTIGSAIAAVISGLFASKVGARVSRDLRKSIFDKVQDFSMEETQKFSTASLITRSTNDITQIQMVLIMALRFLIMAPTMAITAIVKVIRISPTLSLLIAAGVVILLVSIILIIMVVVPNFRKTQKLNDDLNLVARENLTGMRVVRAYNAENYEREKLGEVNQKLTKLNVFVNRVMGVLGPIMTIVLYGVMVLILVFGAVLIKDGSFSSPAKLTEFFTYTMHIIMSFMFISMIFVMIPRAMVSARRVQEVLTTETKIHDPLNPVKPLKLGKIEFKDVSFKYPDGSDYVLENINFTANKGEVVAFIGSTGSGKTSLINLIPRFYEASVGEVLVDGFNVKDYAQDELRQMIGYVPQKGILFSGTVESNINFGKEELDREHLIKSAKIAQASDFIDEMGNGYSSSISQGGQNVSGGQKQRLSIARAIMKKPCIYIFDDSFSALDFKTDQRLRKALAEETDGATCLIVAQRIGTTLNADKIIVLNEGKIVGVGKHQELMESCQVYQEIASSQLSKEELQNA